MDGQQDLQNIQPKLARSSGAVLCPSRASPRIQYLSHHLSTTFSGKTKMMSCLEFDDVVCTSLHLFPTSTKSHCLFNILDKTQTAMGKRLLHQWLRSPLCDREEIIKRQEAIHLLMENPLILANLRDEKNNLKRMIDINGAIQRLKSRECKAATTTTEAAEIDLRQSSYILRDMIQIYRALAQSESIVQLLVRICPLPLESSTTCPDLSTSQSQTENCIDLTADSYPSSPVHIEDNELLGSTLGDNLLQSLILALKEKLSKLQRLRALVEHLFDLSSLPNLHTFQGLLTVRAQCSSSLWSISQQLSQSRDELQLSYTTLLQQINMQPKDVKLEQNDVHGWHLRVTKTLSNRVLKAFESKKIAYRVLAIQKAGTLFVPNSMQKGVDKVKACEKRYEELQHEVVQQALGVFLTYSSLLLAVGDILAVVDVLAALSHIAISNNWTTPTILPANDQMVGTEIHITGLRHPILEDQLGAMGVVANDVDISPPRRLMLVTGPNMGGKSTYLRATGICILLAQMGSMVPAQSVTMTLFDRLFIRSGATDCTSMNQSTFMVEMLEMSKILRDATSSSLVLLDEVGRGTSTNDGFGIAYALLRHLAEETGCITLCATHFHELSQLCAESDRYYACHVVATMQEGQRDDVTMLYQVRPGQSADSLGIAVARLAEFPENIIANALALEESWKEQEAHGMTTSTMAAITGMKRSIEEGGCCG